MREVHADNLQVHYFTAGEQGLPVILLHGGGTDSAMLSWKLCLQPLAETHRVYTFDWPGYGQSAPLAEGAYTTEQLITVLHRLIDEWQIAQASLVGISMGGAVALGYTLAFPTRVRKLVLVDSYGLQERAPFHGLSYLFLRIPYLTRLTWVGLRRSRWLTKLALQSIFHNASALSDELVDEVLQAIQNTHAEVSFYAWQRDEVRWGRLKTFYVDRLQTIMTPTLLIHGEHDKLVPVACAYRAAQLIPNAQLRVMNSCGHWPQRENPDEFNQVTLAFLA